MSVLLVTAPIMLTMIIGFSVQRLGWLSKEGWSGIEQICFRVLFPVLLLKSIALSEFDVLQVKAVLMVCVLVLALIVAGILLVQTWLGAKSFQNPDMTTLIQTSTRWNMFIALAASDAALGPHGSALVAACMAVLVPLINAGIIVVMVKYGSAKATARDIVMSVLKNPFVQVCVLGLLINVIGVPLPVVVVDTLDLIGGAALGLALLSVGASIQIRRLVTFSKLTFFGALLRPVLMPILAATIAKCFGFDYVEVAVVALVFSTPSASVGYVVAKNMGGNAEAYSDILTWQVILSPFAIPIILSLI